MSTQLNSELIRTRQQELQLASRRMHDHADLGAAAANTQHTARQRMRRGGVMAALGVGLALTAAAATAFASSSKVVPISTSEPHITVCSFSFGPVGSTGCGGGCLTGKLGPSHLTPDVACAVSALRLDADWVAQTNMLSSTARAACSAVHGEILARGATTTSHRRTARGPAPPTTRVSYVL